MITKLFDRWMEVVDKLDCEKKVVELSKVFTKQPALTTKLEANVVMLELECEDLEREMLADIIV